MINHSIELTEHDMVVHVLHEPSIIEYLNACLPDKLGPNDTFETYEAAVIVVKGGYILIDHDCCYQISETEMVPGYKSEIVERLRVSARIKRSIPQLNGGGGFMCNTVKRFSFMINAKVLISSFSKGSRTLKQYMAERYNYNPRIIKNMRELIKLVNNYNINS